MTDTFAAIAAFDGRIAKVTGPVRSGKTEALLRRAAHALANGCAPEDILLATTTAEAARIARQRLAALLAARGADDAAALAARVTVASAQEACLAVLATPQAQAATGRAPRVLAPFEYNFFLEDMKTLGTPVRRLRAVLNHFNRQWCALAPEEDWVVPGDEQQTLDLAHRLLHATNAMLADEVAYVCGRYLQSEEGSSARQAFSLVLADDFQNLSAAQQTCLCLLARDQLIVAGNPGETIAAATSCPNAAGFTDFDRLRRDVTTFALSAAFGNPAVTAFCDAVAQAGDCDAAVAAQRVGKGRPLSTVKWNAPEDEFNGLTRYLMDLAAKAPDAPLAGICVVAPNKTWATALSQMLSKRGFTVSSLGFERLGGDPRETARARALMAYTALNLLADPDDLFAWRAWVGYGNYLTYSDGWKFLLAWCDEHDAGVLEALDAASKARAAGDPEPFPRAERLAERYDAGRAMIAQQSARRGHGLLAAIGAQDLREFDALAQAIAGDEDATALYALARASQFSPTHDANPRALRLSSYEQLCGCNYRAVYAAGCVDGFMPARDAFEVVSTDDDRTRVREADRRAFAAGVGKASDTLMFSTFSTADLELAERTKMQVTRVRMEGGRRVAAVRPTCFIEEAGAAAPLTQSGQTLLADTDIA
ncbi:UvrD-helicase domain-containing protein [Adlercreutzia sp. R7]|uniref:UvrD-helicase domain-containing protein n=1 Tax=Adlercreutzia wanghongyangiae TaxID=3111451 RepID=A0ABU6IEQ2_9ACTN|nr:UvrD-helicase domain-containing protein [Adlercreutzia sp. R7]